jgi:DNA-binding IclR family transcriptional regulator
VLPSGRLERLTPKTITVRSMLEEELVDVRRRGYAVTDEELELGLAAVAAPVRRREGAVVAAISVSGPSTRFSQQRFNDVAAQCIAETNALSALLGYLQQREGAA